MPPLWQPQHAALLVRRLGLRPLAGGAPFVFTERFEGGTDAAAVTTSNSAFTNVVAGFTFTTSGVASGRLAARSASTAGVNASMEYAALTPAPAYFLRLYVYFTATPVGGGVDLVTWRGSATARTRLTLNTDGTVALRNGATVVYTTTAALTAGRLNRIEYRVDNDAALQQVRLFLTGNVHGVTADEDSGAQTYNQGTLDTLRVGQLNGTNTSDFVWIADEVVARSDAWVGPATDVAAALADTASGADALSVAAQVPLTDIAAATDALAVAVTAALSDSVAATDAGAVAAAVPLADTGTASDALAVAVRVPSADTAAGTDNLGVAVAAPLPDTATASDALTVPSVSASLPDTAAGTDTAAVTAAVPLSDTASATDALAVTAVAVPLADTATGTDALTLPGGATSVTLTDSATTTDALSVSVATAPADTASGADTLAVVAAVPLADAGASSDTLTVAAVVVILTDTAVATDALTASSGGHVTVRIGAGRSRQTTVTGHTRSTSTDGHSRTAAVVGHSRFLDVIGHSRTLIVL